MVVTSCKYLGTYVNGKGLEESLRIAADYVCESIKCNLEDENQYGMELTLKSNVN